MNLLVNSTVDIHWFVRLGFFPLSHVSSLLKNTAYTEKKNNQNQQTQNPKKNPQLPKIQPNVLGLKAIPAALLENKKESQMNATKYKYPKVKFWKTLSPLFFPRSGNHSKFNLHPPIVKP